MNYTFEELWEKLDDYYSFYDDFARALCKGLTFVSRDEADRILEDTFFIPFYGESWQINRDVIRGRNVVIICEEDLAKEDVAILTILHEAGHSLLGHKGCRLTGEEVRKREDECWEQVRKWLPVEFTALIDTAEQDGGGSRGRR